MNRWNAFCLVTLALSVILFAGAFAAARSVKRDWEAEYNQCSELRKVEARACSEAWLKCGRDDIALKDSPEVNP
jgi:hypothetical protein